MNCPNCNTKILVKTLNTPYMGIRGVRECPKCEAIFGQCMKGDSYRIVKPFMTDQESDNLFYYDLSIIGSTGLERRHGWADKNTRLIVQVG